MNTERDNFYDWAKDKPDTSSFAGLNSAYGPVRATRQHHGGMPWGRIGMLIVVAVIVVAALKHYIL